MYRLNAKGKNGCCLSLQGAILSSTVYGESCGIKKILPQNVMLKDLKPKAACYIQFTCNYLPVSGSVFDGVCQHILPSQVQLTHDKWPSTKQLRLGKLYALSITRKRT